MKKQLIDFYLDWVNNFHTYDRMAEYYGLTVKEVSDLVDMGRKYHEQNVELFKSAQHEKRK